MAAACACRRYRRRSRRCLFIEYEDNIISYRFAVFSYHALTCYVTAALRLITATAAATGIARHYLYILRQHMPPLLFAAMATSLHYTRRRRPGAIRYTAICLFIGDAARAINTPRCTYATILLSYHRH